MNEEEKKAINYLTNYINWETFGERNLTTDIKTVLNLVTKLQKENEELKAITKTYDALKNTQENIVIADKKFFDNGYFNENLIPISFIKEIQEKLNCDNNIKILDELIDCYLDNKFKNKRQ